MAGARSVQGLVEFVRTLGAARLGAMAAVTAALVGVFAFIILRVTAPQMSPVFTDLTPEDSAAKQPDELKASLEKTGETEKILGYTCEKYLLKTKDATSELWLTDGLGTFLGLGSGANPMGGWHAKGATAQAWEKALAGKNMFPLRVVGLTGRGKGDRMEVTEIKKESVPDSEFVPPDDFKKFELPPVADMLKGLMKGLTPENQ